MTPNTCRAHKLAALPFSAMSHTLLLPIILCSCIVQYIVRSYMHIAKQIAVLEILEISFKDGRHVTDNAQYVLSPHFALIDSHYFMLSYMYSTRPRDTKEEVPLSPIQPVNPCLAAYLFFLEKWTTWLWKSLLKSKTWLGDL